MRFNIKQGDDPTSIAMAVREAVSAWPTTLRDAAIAACDQELLQFAADDEGDDDEAR